ncbi:MAG TPA: hypothetical protein VNO19_14535 [Gemmatimonadales bacterium]|nr:hypothetical protein [Gemmatimonadales bacterium]
MLDAERATSELSRDSGFAGAVLGSFHRDGILLWPGAPVMAGTSDLKRLLTELPSDSLQLTWQPLGIELSRDSSLSVTWGVAVASAGGSAPTPEIGSYIAAWRRDGGRWSIAALVFAGLRRLPKPALSGKIPVSRKAIQARGASAPFIAADIAFARLAADSGAAVAFERWAAPEAVTFGDRGLLTRGPEAIGRAVDFPAAWQWHPVAAGAARSGDLGWTVGEATIAGKDGTSQSKYLTIWTRSGDGLVRFLTDGGNGRPASR